MPLLLVAVFAVVATSPGVAIASEPPAWTGYGPGFETAEEAGANAAVSVGATGANVATTGWVTTRDGYEFGMETVRPPDRPEADGDACWYWRSAPYGGWNGDGELNAKVIAHVDCNFVAPRITYVVEFHGKDPANGSFVKIGRTATCYNTNHCEGAEAYYYSGRACRGSFDHWGVAYGHFWNSDNEAKAIPQSGQDGPHKTGASYGKYC